MKKLLLLSVSILAVFVCAAVLMCPVAAGAAASSEVRAFPGPAEHLASVPMGGKTLELVSPDEALLAQDTAARTFKMYVDIYDWSCVDGYVNIWINGKYKGAAASGPGKYYIGTFYRGSKYQIQCRDSDGYPYWKSKRTYINSKTFTWILRCP